VRQIVLDTETTGLEASAGHRVIEIGSIWYSPALQRTRVATEAMYLLARNAFETLGYRRYEWKCNTFNEPSRRAALRLGFTYEGLFRQHMISRGRNRDTAWFSMLDHEWPQRSTGHQSLAVLRGEPGSEPGAGQPAGQRRAVCHVPSLLAGGSGGTCHWASAGVTFGPPG